MISTYIYEANAIVFAYDITNFQSFLDLEDWLGLVTKSFAGREPPLMCLVGNKVDLNNMQAVKVDSHQQFAAKHKMRSHYCSAKTGD